MTTLYFQLGREKELCLYELANVVNLYGMPDLDLEKKWPSVSFSGSGTDVETVCGVLGGCVRAVEFLGDYSEDLLFAIEAGNHFIPDGPWGVSSFSSHLRDERERIRTAVKTLVKQSDQAHGREERPKPGQLELSPARVQELRFDRTGSELCLWEESRGKIRVGVTRWVSDTRGFEMRDIEKPFRPQRRGLLPPKLARQMINLGRTPRTWRMLDPFCGCGVTLLEGLDLGLQVAGSDNRDEAIRQTAKNLDWFLAKPGGGSKSGVAFVENLDVRQISTKIPPLSLDLVVGEGDLGPPIQGRLGRKAAVEFSARLEALYTRAFAEIRTLLSPGGRVSLAVPFWQPNDGDPIFINLERKLRLIGYGPVFPKKGFEPFLYRRKDQKVGRAIYVLKSPE